MSTFSTIAYNLRTNLHAAGYVVPLGHCQQAVAAIFGFNSLAAFQASDLYPDDLQNVGHVIIDEVHITNRTEALGPFPSAQIILRAITAALDTAKLRARTHGSLMHFQDFLQQQLEQFVQEDSDVVSATAMAMANHDGIDEIYLPFEFESELANSDNHISIDIEGHIGLSVDVERPFSGNKVNVVANIATERLSASTFSNVEYFVESASLDYGWSDDDEEDRPPRIPFELALANELGLTVEEAETLVDIEPQALTSDDGSITYSYILDFEDIALEPVRSKLLAQYDSLQIEVDANFFDNVRQDFY